MEINLNTKIIDVVNTRITSLHPKDSIDKAVTLFEQTNRNILPVVVGEEFKGILHRQNFDRNEKSNTFMIRLGSRQVDVSAMVVEDFYRRDVMVENINTQVIDALQFFVKYRQYYIPVVDGRKFVGLVTPFDIFQFLIDHHNPS